LIRLFRIQNIMVIAVSLSRLHCQEVHSICQGHKWHRMFFGSGYYLQKPSNQWNLQVLLQLTELILQQSYLFCIIIGQLCEKYIRRWILLIRTSMRISIEIKILKIQANTIKIHLRLQVDSLLIVRIDNFMWKLTM